MRRREAVSFFAVAVAPAVWPAALKAQQTERSYRIGYLALLPGEDTTLMKPVVQRLNELGYGEGRNLTLVFRTADGQADRLPLLAREMVGLAPDVLVTGFGTLTVQAAKAATSTIPIVFTSVGDPVGAGLVASLSRPAANITGVTSQASEIVGKQLQLLEEIVPGNRRVAVLLNPATPFANLALQELRAAASLGRQRLEVFETRTAQEIIAAVETAIRSGTAGLFAVGDPLMLSVRQQIADLAEQGRLPTVFGSREFVQAGGLISYGVDRRQQNRRAGEFVDKILKGARPSDLPIEQPTAFELVINMKTAKALGLAIPASLLARADEVIE
jgi:putative ABC transport system substrate-binding protein